MLRLWTWIMIHVNYELQMHDEWPNYPSTMCFLILFFKKLNSNYILKITYTDYDSFSQKKKIHYLCSLLTYFTFNIYNGVIIYYTKSVTKMVLILKEDCLEEHKSHSPMTGFCDETGLVNAPNKGLKMMKIFLSIVN